MQPLLSNAILGGARNMVSGYWLLGFDVLPSSDSSEWLFGPVIYRSRTDVKGFLDLWIVV